MSGKCRGWAGEQIAPSREIKLFVMAVADYANADGFMWPSVETMAAELQCSGRTVQRMLKAAVEAGLMIRLDVEDRVTGRTRSCGYFFPVRGLPPTVREVSAFEEMTGGRVTLMSPWEGDAAVTGEGDTCVRGRVTTVSPPNDPPLEPSEPEGSSLRAREREALVQRMEAAMTPALLAVSRKPAYLDALDVLEKQGVDLDALPDCLTRWVESKLFKGRRVPVPVERWLLDGQWRGFLPQPELFEAAGKSAGAEVHRAAASPEDRQLWAKVEARLASAMGESEFGSYIRPAFLGARSGLLFLVAGTGVARDRIAQSCWRRVVAWWAETDPAKRPLTLISKAEFEAALSREGVV